MPFRRAGGLACADSDAAIISVVPPRVDDFCREVLVRCEPSYPHRSRIGLQLATFDHAQQVGRHIRILAV
jgi:hypothetical protein